MAQQKAGNEGKEPLSEFGRYSYSDYLGWQMDETVELIKGRVFRSTAAAPKRIHQKISGKVFNRLFNFLEGEKCEVYEAPFDVRTLLAGKYIPSRLYTSGDIIGSKSVPGFQLDLEYVFMDLD